jgi:hypothetical protein
LRLHICIYVYTYIYAPIDGNKRFVIRGKFVSKIRIFWGYIHIHIYMYTYASIEIKDLSLEENSYPRYVFFGVMYIYIYTCIHMRP